MSLRPGVLVRLSFALATGAALAAPALADGFSCGTRVVTTDMTSAAVRAACGDPTEIQQDSILRRPTVWRHGRRYVVGDGYVQVGVERWLYNFGPNRLMQRLRIEDGTVTEIETLGYGFNP